MGGERPGRFCRFGVAASWQPSRGAAQAIHKTLNQKRNLAPEEAGLTIARGNTEIAEVPQCRKLRPVRRFTATTPERLVRRVLPSNLTPRRPLHLRACSTTVRRPRPSTDRGGTGQDRTGG
jgi:hypothetical protein